MARQIESLLAGGHTVAAVCGADGGLDGTTLFTRAGSRSTWRGLTTLAEVFWYGCVRARSG